MTTAHIPTLKCECEIYKTKWQAIQEEELARSATDALPARDKALFSNVHTLLNILATLPLNTAAVECSFSTSKREQNIFEEPGAEERLNGLALMSIHWMQVSVDEIIAVFTEKARRMKTAAWTKLKSIIGNSYGFVIAERDRKLCNEGHFHICKTNLWKTELSERTKCCQTASKPETTTSPAHTSCDLSSSHQLYLGRGFRSTVRALGTWISSRNSAKNDRTH